MNLTVITTALVPLALVMSSFARHIGRPEAPPPAKIERAYAVQPDQVYTAAASPIPLYADVYTPQGDAPDGRAWPAVLVIHGGGWNSGDREQTRGLAERIAQRGYVAVNISYRLVPGALFPAQLEDAQQALRWMRANAARLRLDPERIGVWGYSAGAQLAALLGGLSPGDRLYSADARVKAVVAGGTPADLRKFHGGTLVPAYLGEHWSENSQAFRESSAAAFVDKSDPPVFLYHGTWDHLVPLDQATDYHAALEAAGVTTELYLMRGLGHIPAFLLDREAVQCGADFLDRYLRN